MCTLSEWRRLRRYQATLRDLRSLAPERLSELGILPADIDRLARAAADPGDTLPSEAEGEAPPVGLVPSWNQSSS
jgi:uncharacterized protein YjiS (DUF1127 family)